MENIIETVDLTKRYSKAVALDSVSIHVRQGEIYGLIGKNGAGKSTLFKTMMGLAPYSSGEVKMFGDSSTSGLNKAHHRIGFMMGAHFFPYLSARENLEYFRKLKGIPDKTEVDRVLKLVEMEKVKKKFKSFSMGMKQRVSIANALMGYPDIVVLDEPINGLDPQGIADFRHLVQKLNKENKTTFMVSSHILGELGMMATRFGFIHDGRLVEEIDREVIRNKTKEQVIVKVSDIEKATCLLEEKFESIEYTVNGDKELVIMKMTDRTAEIAALFVQNDLSLYKLDTQEISIEDYYLQLIAKGGANNV
ncbi:ABC transporter ATP-binding protein [Marinilactibacillus psychrotolerans]|uniref:ABC transporter ATP-binding protein n=1 Tax=Marinilactibacillus psychrotolerans TaxID=191770 RepID=A0AAV3WUL5_9LACT|nr:ATP-binding cassette domain-containing protein [Marinilactibacillus psychrotolerans]GEL67335.1 bacitracin ABC transporter ATP-binding protein [Marinilactibacillus psychrotolerans]GEQ36278.1 ABC transporter ATP-binding protein [Marinilactibacillus psychrotolerans]SDC93519.1 ABC-2 type transport system ATP-binding protein [Marinilactibacillus psychrotolerans]